MKNNYYFRDMERPLCDEIRALLSEDILEYAFPGWEGHSICFFADSVESICEDFAEILSMEDAIIDEIDPRTREIIEALDAIKSKYGLSSEDLDRILNYSVKLSRLHITHSGKILLEDYNGVEVRMDSLCKAVYFLFLKHPEGIDFKSLCDYREELGALYYTFSGKDCSETAERSLDMLCNSTESNSINEKVSRIKRAFENVIEKRIAANYCITGRAGEPKTIPFDRSLVEWD